MSRMERVKKHFDAEAKKFDGIILKNVPYYGEMVAALVNHLVFPPAKSLNIIDLGCGTGTIAYGIKKKFPRAKVRCVDIAPGMINIAKQKLARFDGVKFELADFNKFKFEEKYDAVVSSLALHHLASDKDKAAFFGKVYRALNPGGIFINADIVLASSADFQEVSMQKWKEFLLSSYCAREIMKKWLSKYKDEDRPAALMSQLEWLKKTGFKQVDVFWKYYNFAVYGGSK